MVFGFSLLCSVVFLTLFHFLPLKRWEDVPNHRSMHSKPIKRSAGFIFFLIFGIHLYFFVPEKTVSLESKFFFIVPTWGLSILGLIDDLFNLSSRWKLFLELFFIFFLIIFLPFQISIFGVPIPNSYHIDKFLLTLYVVFIINLANFMDGLDLYLSTTFIVFIWIVYFYLNLSVNEYLFIAFLLLSSMSAFFYYNFPNAKMFMGDSGSLSLGYFLAMAPFYLETNLPNSDLTLLFLLIPVFLIDGIFTLFKRFLEGKNIFSAHREHLYQRMQIEKDWSKIKTITLFSLFNLISIFIYFFFHSYFSLGAILTFSTTLLLGIYIYLFKQLDS